MGMLNSLRHFFIPALSPAMFNVVTIVCARDRSCRWRRRSASHPIVGIAVGTLLGGVAQLALQWPTLRARGLPLPAGCSTGATRACGACCC